MTVTTLSTRSEGSRYLNRPKTLHTDMRMTRMTLTDAGCGEIKQHNINGISEGLRQLRDDCHGGRSRILITFLPVHGPSWLRLRPQDEGVAERVLVMATYITNYYSGMKPKEQAQQVLKQEWYLVEDMRPMPEPVAKVAMGLANRGRFGSVMEPLVADAFDRRVLQPQPPRRRLPEHRGGSGHGSDLLWSELAGLYGELARELGNPFFAELASELATYGETQAA